MNKYGFYSEKEAVRGALFRFFQEKGDDLLELYLNYGFDKVATGLGLFTDFQRKLLFDYLMIDRKALLECLRRNKQFFLKMITDGRGEMIRPMLGLKSSRYDVLWREALDLMSLYFVEKKVIEKMTNLELEKFFQNNIMGLKDEPGDQVN